MRFRVRPTRRLAGSVDVPGDKSVSHRAALLGALAGGTTEIHGLPRGRRLPADDHGGPGAGRRGRRARGPASTGSTAAGDTGCASPTDVIDCGNSGTSARLLMGVLAGQPFWTMLTGDESLRTRPMGRVAEPLRRMGATVVGRAGGTKLPAGGEGDAAAARDHPRLARGLRAGEVGGPAGRSLRRRPGVGHRARAVARPFRAHAAAVRRRARHRRSLRHADAGRSAREHGLGAGRHLVGGLPARRRGADRRPGCDGPPGGREPDAHRACSTCSRR